MWKTRCLTGAVYQPEETNCSKQKWFNRDVSDRPPPPFHSEECYYKETPPSQQQQKQALIAQQALWLLMLFGLPHFCSLHSPWGAGCNAEKEDQGCTGHAQRAQEERSACQWSVETFITIPLVSGVQVQHLTLRSNAGVGHSSDSQKLLQALGVHCSQLRKKCSGKDLPNSSHNT